MRNRTVPLLVDDHSSAGNNVPLTIASMACVVSMGCIMALALFGNILVLTTVCRTKSLRTTATILVVNLALVDLSITVAVLPFVTTTAVTVEEWILPWTACRVTGFVNAFLTGAQIMALFHISVKRYIAVAYPLCYETRCNKRVTVITVFLGWLFSLTWSSLPFVGWGGHLGFINGTLFCNILWSEQLSYAITVQVTCYFVPTIIGTILYFGVYKHVRKQRKRVFEKTLSYELAQSRTKSRTESHDGVGAKTNMSLSYDKICISRENISVTGFEDLRIATSTTSRGKGRRIMEARVTKTLLAVALAFVVCWIPRGVANLWAPSVSREAVPRALEYSSAVFIFLNAAVNPILHGALHQEFRRAFKRILCCGPRVNRRRAATHTSGSVYQR